MMEVNTELPQVRAAAEGCVSTSAVHCVKVCVQPQPRDLIAHLLEMLQSLAGVLDCPVKSELLVGVQEEKRIISVSPKDMEFPIYGLHIADTYQSDSPRKGNLHCTKSFGWGVTWLQPLC